LVLAIFSDSKNHPAASGVCMRARAVPGPAASLSMALVLLPTVQVAVALYFSNVQQGGSAEAWAQGVCTDSKKKANGCDQVPTRL
jgi:hypothetical protein